jgi:hypothetical protein
MRPYFQKTLATGAPLLFVDGSVGIGVFDDGKTGLPLIALKCLETVSPLV